MSPVSAIATPWLGYWPDPADAPQHSPSREAITLIARDGAIVRGILWTPANGTWSTAVVMAHPRGDFSVHYHAELLAASGYAVLGIATRSVNNDTDCVHEACVVDVATAVDELRRRGCDSLIALGNCGGGSLMALALADGAIEADGFIITAAHPGQGVVMMNLIDPSITDEADPFSVDDTLDMFHPDNGWRPWPEPASYDPAWLDRYRAAQRARVARIDAVAHDALSASREARATLAELELGSASWSTTRRHAIFGSTMTVWRTLADPAYLDPTIEPDDRPLGSILTMGDPLTGNYGYGGLARTVTARAWLSTWSGLSSRARMSDTLPRVDIPTLILHPTADTEIRLSQADAMASASGADDLTYSRLDGAPHYLHGHRVAANDLMVSWLRDRFG